MFVIETSIQEVILFLFFRCCTCKNVVGLSWVQKRRYGYTIYFCQFFCQTKIGKEKNVKGKSLEKRTPLFEQNVLRRRRRRRRRRRIPKKKGPQKHKDESFFFLSPRLSAETTTTTTSASGTSEHRARGGGGGGSGGSLVRGIRFWDALREGGRACG